MNIVAKLEDVQASKKSVNIFVNILREQLSHHHLSIPDIESILQDIGSDLSIFELISDKDLDELVTESNFKNLILIERIKLKKAVHNANELYSKIKKTLKYPKEHGVNNDDEKKEFVDNNEYVHENRLTQDVDTMSTTDCDDFDVLKIFNESMPKLIEEIFRNFYNCHHLMESSWQNGKEIISKKTQRQIEQCAVDFRMFSQATTHVATLVADVFCREAISLFENLNKLPKGNIIFRCQRLSHACCDLTDIFQILRDYVSALCGRIDASSRSTEENVTDFVKAYSHAQNVAKRHQQTQKEIVDKYEEKIDDYDKKIEKNVAMCRNYWWSFIIPVVTFVDIVDKVSKRTVTRVAKSFADRELLQAKHALTQANENFDEASRLALEAMKLAELLRRMKDFCDGMCIFWQWKSNEFAAYENNINTVGHFVRHGQIITEFELAQELRLCRAQLRQYGKTVGVACNLHHFDTTDIVPNGFTKYHGRIISAHLPVKN